MRGQASMIDILLLGLFISIVLVGSSVFIGKEELRAQKGREEAVFAQAQFITALGYRGDGWSNMTAAEALNLKFCDRTIKTVEGVSCSANDQFYGEMQAMLNRTGRTDYSYIFYAEAKNASESADGYVLSVRNLTVCNRQPTVCAKHIPAIATSTMLILCPTGETIRVFYLHGIWPGWQTLPLTCED